MSKFKRGDLVRVVDVDSDDLEVGVELGAVYEVGAIDSEGDVHIIGTFRSFTGVVKDFTSEYYSYYDDGEDLNAPVLYANQVELIKESSNV